MESPRWIQAVWRRAGAVLLSTRAERDLRDELAFHLAMQERSNVQRGMSQDKAARRAQYTLGGIEQAKERCRDVRPLRWGRDFVSDVRHGTRSLRKSPMFGAFVEEHRDHPLVGCPEHVHKRHGHDLGAMRDSNPTHLIPTQNVRSVDLVNSFVNPTAAVRIAVAPRLARLLIVVSLAMVCVAIVAAQSKAIAVANVTLIDGTGARPRVVTVIVEDDRITAIARNGRTRIPTGATIVDGRGKYLIPGLWDMHVHIGGYNEGTKVLPRLVAYGITGVRDMASRVDDILRLRRESADGTLLGPQIVAAGPILQRPLPFRTPPLVRTVTDEDAKQVVDDLQVKGVDFIKVGDTLTRHAYFGIASEAKRLVLPFAGHLPVSVTALEATQAGQRSIEHFGSAGFRNVLIACSSVEAELTSEVRDALSSALAGGPSPDETLYRSEFLTRLVQTYDRRKAAVLFSAFKKNGTWQVPTFGALRSVWEARRAQLNPDDVAATDSAARKTVEMFADMRKAGVKVLAGSDLPASTGAPPLHDELVALVRAGMTPLEALQASTRNAAEFTGRLANEGTIEAGKKANLVLLEADPLADIANTRRVAAVVLGGRLISGVELQRLR